MPLDIELKNGRQGAIPASSRILLACACLLSLGLVHIAFRLLGERLDPSGLQLWLEVAAYVLAIFGIIWIAGDAVRQYAIGVVSRGTFAAKRQLQAWQIARHLLTADVLDERTVSYLQEYILYLEGQGPLVVELKQSVETLQFDREQGRAKLLRLADVAGISEHAADAVSDQALYEVVSEALITPLGDR